MAIRLSEVQYRWPGGSEAFLAIDDFTVNCGERVFLSGPSGSGKTTLLGLIGGVLLPEQGTVRVLDCDINRLSGGQRDRYRADHIGYIFQMFNLLPYLDVLDNVVLPLRFSKRRRAKLAEKGKDYAPEEEARRLLASLGLDDANLLRRQVGQLSVGQQQRVAAARALIGAPEVLIADEPTSALDTDAREGFLRLLFGECQRLGTTLVYVSHDRGMAGLFDRTVKIESFHAGRASYPAAATESHAGPQEKLSP